jgi:hypothetical protein
MAFKFIKFSDMLCIYRTAHERKREREWSKTRRCFIATVFQLLFRICRYETPGKTQVGLKLNGTHQLLIYADNINLVGDNIDSIKKITETLTDASKEVGLEVNAEKTKYMLLSRDQNAGLTDRLKMSNSSNIWEPQ